MRYLVAGGFDGIGQYDDVVVGNLVFTSHVPIIISVVSDCGSRLFELSLLESCAMWMMVQAMMRGLSLRSSIVLPKEYSETHSRPASLNILLYSTEDVNQSFILLCVLLFAVLFDINEWP
jgi:hypothetical protein